jgi:signal transduction histidine kinase
VSVASDLPRVRGAQSDVDQVLLNLVTNARDALPDGGALRIEARATDGRVRVIVEDTGAGIPEEDLPRIFEPFFTTKPHGSGLGLAVCRSIVWGMRGRLDLRSRPGEGTRVELDLPADDGRDGPAEEA